MSQVFSITGSGLVPIETEALQIGQRVRQARDGEEGVICAKENYGYTIIYPDGRQAHAQQLNSRSPFTCITPIDGPLATTDEVNALLNQRDAKRAADKVAASEEAQRHHAEVLRLTAELEAKYPKAIPLASTISEHARAAKNMRAELKAAFPGIKFSIRSKSFAGGDDVRVSWDLGPTRQEVAAITDKYEEGSFDSMNDLYSYDRSAMSAAVSIVLGQAKYVLESRHYPDGIFEQVGRALCALQKVEYNGIYTMNLLGTGDRQPLQDHVYELMAKTSFKANEEFRGLEFIEWEERKNASPDPGWVRIVKGVKDGSRK
jgi:hypothetical protein